MAMKATNRLSASFRHLGSLACLLVIYYWNK